MEAVVDGERDERLVGRLRTGADDAFEELYERFVGRVHGLAHKELGDRAEAEDATQEVFLIVLRNVERYAELGSLDAWVFGITRNVVRNRWRARGRREAREALAGVPPASATPEQELLEARVLAAVRDVLDGAEEWEADVFNLCCLSGVSKKEAARRIQRSRYAVSASLERLRSRVARQLA